MTQSDLNLLFHQIRLPPRRNSSLKLVVWAFSLIFFAWFNIVCDKYSIKSGFPQDETWHMFLKKITEVGRLSLFIDFLHDFSLLDIDMHQKISISLFQHHLTTFIFIHFLHLLTSARPSNTSTSLHPSAAASYTSPPVGWECLYVTHLNFQLGFGL